MINLTDKFTGDIYTFDETTNEVYKNNELVSQNEVEPIFSSNDDDFAEPIFTGLFLKFKNQILNVNGNSHTVTNLNSIKWDY